MADNDFDKTTTYGDSDKNKTEAYSGSESQKTEAYNSNQEKTSTYSDLQENKSKTHGLGVGDKITLRNEEYLITAIVSEGTGEAVIYKIEDKSKNIFVLKLYFEFTNLKEEPNFETLKRIKEITDPDILKLYDFGVGADKYQGRYCYEVSDFAEGGDLFDVDNFKRKYTKDFIEECIVPELFNGIKKLHEYNIHHCDLKPSNIFFKDSQQTDLIIGDYGSAKAKDLEIKKEFRKSSTVKGTDQYLAPEQARGFVSEKNDYYSFGIILLHLLYPEQFSSENNFRTVDKIKFDKIGERQYNYQQVVDFNPDFKRLNNLIEGLTLINPIKRFGKKEVERWFNGEDVEVKYKEAISIQPIKLGYATISNDSDFIHALETFSSWYEDLIEDQDTYSTVKIWMDSYKDIPSRKVFDSMIKYYQPLGKDYVKEAILRYFDPEREIRIDMNSFNFFTSNNIKKDVEEYISKLDEIWKITSIDKIKFYIFQFEFCLRQIGEEIIGSNKTYINAVLDKVSAVLNISPKEFFLDYQTLFNPKLNDKELIELFYAFDGKRSFRDDKNKYYDTLEKLALFFAENKEKFNDKYLSLEKKIYMSKINQPALNKYEYTPFLFKVFKGKEKTFVSINEIQVGKNRTYSFRYTYQKSLFEFFKSKNIDNNLLEKSNSIHECTIKKRFYSGLGVVFNGYINHVQNKHNISSSSITGTNKSQLYKLFKSHAIKNYFSQGLIFSSIGFIIIGLFVGHLVNSFLNNQFNPYADLYNLYSPTIIFTLIGFVFFLIGASISFKFQKAINLTTLLFIFILGAISFGFVWFLPLYKESEKIFKHRHEYYINNYFEISETQNKTLVSYDQIIPKNLKAELDLVKERISKYYKYTSVTSLAKVVSRRISNPGWLKPYIINVAEVEQNENGKFGNSWRDRWRDQLFSVYITWPNSLSKFTKSNPTQNGYYYPFEINFKARTSQTGYNNRFGIFINEYIVLLNKNMITLLKTEYPENYQGNKKQPEDIEKLDDYVIVSGNISKAVTSGSGSSLTLGGFNIPQYSYSDLVRDYWEIGTANIELEAKKFQTIKIVFLAEKFFVEINDKVILIKELPSGFWEADPNRLNNMGLVFEPYAKFDLKSVHISQINELQTKTGKNHRYIPIIAQIKKNITPFKDLEKKVTTDFNISEGQIVEILYNIGDHTKIKYNNKFAYCKKDELENFDWSINFNTLEQ